MLKIDWKQYPKILNYLGEHAEKSYLTKPNEFTLLDEETYISIVESWIDKFEKNIDVMVENTFSLYELTGGETGYQAMVENWKRRREVFKVENRFDRELIRKWWTEKLVACISHLYQGWNGKDCHKTISGGATGCMIICSFRVQFLDSDLKSVKYNVVTDFTMSLEIQSCNHLEIDMYEQ
jgi:hypothetical protein